MSLVDDAGIPAASPKKLSERFSFDDEAGLVYIDGKPFPRALFDAATTPNGRWFRVLKADAEGVLFDSAANSDEHAMRLRRELSEVYRKRDEAKRLARQIVELLKVPRR